jgi:hypothetical protein
MYGKGWIISIIISQIDPKDKFYLIHALKWEFFLGFFFVIYSSGSILSLTERLWEVFKLSSYFFYASANSISLI